MSMTMFSEIRKPMVMKLTLIGGHLGVLEWPP